MAEVEEGVPVEPEPEPPAAGGKMALDTATKKETSAKHKELNRLVLDSLMRSYR